MVAWLFYRLGQALLTAWLIASAVFLFSQWGLSAAERQQLSRADTLEHLHAGPTEVTAVSHRLGLDQPAFYFSRVAGPPARWQWHGSHNQYHAWLLRLLHGNLGFSYRDEQPVTAQLGPALACTLPLVGLALLLAPGLALWLATYLASAPPGRVGAAAVRAVLAGVQALPLFALALLLLWLFANPELLDVLPASDSYALASNGWARFFAYLARLALPLAALVVTTLPELTLPLAAALRHELTSPYATAALAKGLSQRQLIWRHALPLAALPLLATLSELLPALVAGAVVLEVLFALPGMGRLLAEAAATHDYPVLLAGVLLTAAARLLALLLADVVHHYLDPRLRTALI